MNYYKLKDYVTIVIPCKNEEGYIGNLLQDISLQNNSDGIRIIIADANSTDNTIGVIDEYTKRYNLNVEVIEGGNVSVGRNNGLKLVKTPYTFFIDADVTFFDKNTLLNTLYALKDQHYSLVTARLKCYKGSFLVKTAYSFYNVVHSILVKKYPFAIGLYFCVKTEDFIERGIFNEESDNSEDFLSSQKYKPIEFKFLDDYVGQDDRRVKKMGIFGMSKHLIGNFYRFLIDDRETFKKKSKYWDE